MVIHWLIVNGPRVKNSTAARAISVARIEEQQATVVEIVLVIAAVQGIGVEGQIAVEARLETVLPVVVTLARAIDLAALEIAAPEIALEVGT